VDIVCGGVRGNTLILSAGVEARHDRTTGFALY